MGAFGWSKKGGYACNRASLSGNGIMGACFQAPHAAPGHKPMEMKPVVFYFVFMTYLQSLCWQVMKYEITN